MRLGALIRKWRTMSELTVRVAAPMIGISAATLSRIERGEPMDGATLAKVLRWMLEEEE